MKTKLKIEQLERRDAMSAVTWADIKHAYSPEVDPMPGAPADRILVSGAKLPDGRITDVFVGGREMGARIVIRDTATGETLTDQVVFGIDTRIGVKDIAVIGHELFVSPEVGGGPVIAGIDLTTFEVRHLAVGFPADWRGGVRLATADVDHVGGAPSPHPREELLVLPGGDGGGPQLLILDPDTGADHLPPIWVGDPSERVGLEVVPASAGVNFPEGSGLSVQLADQPFAWYRPDTRSYTWAGERVSGNPFPGESAFDVPPIRV